MDDMSATINTQNSQVLFSIEGNGARPSHKGSGISDSDKMFTLNTIEKHSVANEQIVRRLTPTECARLQGFPDWWCDDLETQEPTEEEMSFWRGVFNTFGQINGLKKEKTDKQIKKWLADPHTDSAEYKMWGNGVALPCVCRVMAGIVEESCESD